MADYKAASIAFENVLNDFPATKLKSKIYNYILKSKAELAINSVYDLKKERIENAIAFAKQTEREFPNSENSKDAVEIKEELEKEAVNFSKLEKEVEARKAEFSEKQKEAEARLQQKEQYKKQAKDQQISNQIKLDSAKISTPEPAATFKIRRN
jgi:outer membrane protein assembly factor BamD